MRRLAFWVAVTLLFVITLTYLKHPARIDVVTYTADKVWIKLPGLLSLFRESNYQLFCEPIRGEEGGVNFHANFEHQPLIVFCPTNGGSILCLYDSDVLIRLIKIDTKQTFQAFPKVSPLNWIVQSSSFDVREGTKDDWKLAIDCLDCMDSSTFRRQSILGLNVGLLSVIAYRKQLLQNIRKQADAMYQLKSDETTMPLFGESK